MNNTEPNTNQPEPKPPRVVDFIVDVFAPSRTAPNVIQKRLLRIRQAIATVGLLATLVQVVIWLMIAVLSRHLDFPWWTFTAVPAVIAIGTLTAIESFISITQER